MDVTHFSTAEDSVILLASKFLFLNMIFEYVLIYDGQSKLKINEAIEDLCFKATVCLRHSPWRGPLVIFVSDVILNSLKAVGKVLGSILIDNVFLFIVFHLFSSTVRYPPHLRMLCTFLRLKID